MASAIDHFNKKGTDLWLTDGTCEPYSFNSVSGMSLNGGGAEDVIGGIMYANASSVAISGGFKTFTQVGFTSGATFATVFIDGGSAVTMNGTLFSTATSPGNIFNLVIQNSSFLNDTNSTLPTGGNGFIGYSGTSAKCDFNLGVLTCTNSSGNSTFGAMTATYGGKITTYNGVATVGNGIPQLVAKADATAQAADIGTTLLYAVPSTGAGFYRISCYTVITQAATTSSTLPGCQARWTDTDSAVAQAQTLTGTPTTNTVGTIGQSQAATAPFGIMNVAASTNIQWDTTAYASVGATVLQYAVHVKLEYLGN